MTGLLYTGTILGFLISVFGISGTGIVAYGEYGGPYPINEIGYLNLGTQNGIIGVSTSSDTKSQDNESSTNEKSQVQLHGSLQASSIQGIQEHYMNSYQKIQATSDNEITVQPERHLYIPGDQVNISGTIWVGLIDAASGIDTVSIQVTDSENNEIYDGKGQVDNNKTYLVQFQLPAEAKEGAYNIHIKPDINSSILNLLPSNAQASLNAKGQFVVASPGVTTFYRDNRYFQIEIATSSSSVNSIKFDQQAKILSFRVQGHPGTVGVTEIIMPRNLLGEGMFVKMDGQVMAQSDIIETENMNNQTLLEINYHHSVHTIDIFGTNPIPEFPITSFVLAISVGLIPLFYSKLHKIRN